MIHFESISELTTQVFGAVINSEVGRENYTHVPWMEFKLLISECNTYKEKDKRSLCRQSKASIILISIIFFL